MRKNERVIINGEMFEFERTEEYEKLVQEALQTGDWTQVVVYVEQHGTIVPDEEA
jgi:hypothetical protein